MGKKSSKHKQPSPRRIKREYEVVKCHVCNQPSAEITTLQGLLTRPVRLACTLRRITEKDNGEIWYACEKCYELLRNEK